MSRRLPLQRPANRSSRCTPTEAYAQAYREPRLTVQFHNKRLVSGGKLWNSEKLAHLEPKHKPEYPWLLPLADTNGNIELDLRAIHVHCYGINRSEVSFEDVQAIFEDFKKNGLLFCWIENGHEFGHFTGMDTDGLLPSPKKRWHYAVIKVTRHFLPDDPDVLAYMENCKRNWTNGGPHSRVPDLIETPPTTHIPSTIPTREITSEELRENYPDPEAPERRCICHGKTSAELIPSDIWTTFVTFRKQLGKPLYAVAHFRERLIHLHEQGQDIKEMLDYAIANNRPDVVARPKPAAESASEDWQTERDENGNLKWDPKIYSRPGIKFYTGEPPRDGPPATQEEKNAIRAQLGLPPVEPGGEHKDPLPWRKVNPRQTN